MSIVGIDLGTTTSEVAFYKNGEGIIIKNIQEGDSTIIPSVVLINNNEIKVGNKAKNQMVLRPKNTISEIKKFIGTNKIITVDGEEYTPVDISAMILKKIKEVAEFYIGESVEEAVITVPANFNDKQRKETKLAGEKAGLKVERIINEPTAAAIAYGIDKLKENMNILVYDFGGGTTDVTVLELFNGILDVKASRGNNELGGKDIDEIIIEYIVETFFKENNISLDTSNPRIASILKSTSEDAKKSLSFEKETEIIIPYICSDEKNNPIDLNITLTSDNLEGMCMDIIKSTEEVINDTLRASNLKEEEIDKVILVGGSTRMPCIQNMIKRKFGINKIARGVNNDEVVAVGASLQGAIKMGIMEAEKNIVVLDTCSHTLGVEVIGSKLNSIIKRDSKLPAKVTKKYKTVDDNQEFAEIKIYEGESEDVSQDTFIDVLEINNIPKNKRGMEEIEITFKYDLNGILDVSVKLISTGQVRGKQINTKEEFMDLGDLTLENKELLEKNKNVIKVDDNNEVEKFDEDIDEEEAYRDVYNLTNYVNEHIEEYDDEEQKVIKERLQDLLKSLQQSDFKGCREIELEIIGKLNLGEGD